MGNIDIENEKTICTACISLKADRQRQIVDMDVGAIWGLQSVTATHVEAIVCGDCGEKMLDGKVIDALEAQLIGAVLAQSYLDGEGASFLRKHLRLTREALGTAVGRTPAQVQSWEKYNGAPLTDEDETVLRNHVKKSHMTMTWNRVDPPASIPTVTMLAKALLRNIRNPSSGVGGQMLTEYTCDVCEKSHEHGSTNVPKVCPVCMKAVRLMAGKHETSG